GAADFQSSSLFLASFLLSWCIGNLGSVNCFQLFQIFPVPVKRTGRVRPATAKTRSELAIENGGNTCGSGQWAQRRGQIHFCRARGGPEAVKDFMSHCFLCSGWSKKINVQPDGGEIVRVLLWKLARRGEQPLAQFGG